MKSSNKNLMNNLFILFICYSINMNNLMLVVVVLVLFVYFGGSNVPKVLRDKKEMLLGAAGALVLCSFFGLRMEGFNDLSGCQRTCPGNDRACADIYAAGGDATERTCDDLEKLPSNSLMRRPHTEVTPLVVTPPLVVTSPPSGGR